MTDIALTENVHSCPDRPMRIDVGAVLRSKLGPRARFIPRFVVRGIESIIKAPQLNALLANNHGKTGADFCKGALSDLNVKVSYVGMENLPPRSQRRVIFACNHPLGGADGLALIAFMHDYYGGNVYVVVNDILMAVEPLRDVFIPVNKHGSQSHSSLLQLDKVLQSDNPVLFFPAGLVSRLKNNGEISDLKWHKTFVNKAIAHSRPVVPLFFSGENSKFFYKFARFRERLGLKFNIEMVRLPAELVRLNNTVLTVCCGKPVPVSDLKSGKEIDSSVERVRRMVYSLKEQLNR